MKETSIPKTLTSVVHEKTRLRTQAKALRQALTPYELKTRNEALNQRLIAYLSSLGIHTVGIFYPLKGEVDVRGLDHHYDTFYPLIEAGTLVFAPATKDFVKAPFNTFVPDTKERVDNALDVVIVPGLFFDEEGFRLGYGKGYYDQYLANHDALFIGVCLEPFLIPTLPKEAHDQRVHLMITDERTVTF